MAYHGLRDEFGIVSVLKDDGTELKPRLDLFNHSPCGFEWGYSGSGPAQLALAILADFLDNDDHAVCLHQAFKWKVIARFKEDRWVLTGDQIKQALIEIIEEREEAEYCL